jgi:hypothetical protein
MSWLTLIKAALGIGRAVEAGVEIAVEAVTDVDVTELSRVAADALRPHGPPEPSQPLPYRDVERQRAQAAESARPPPLPEPEPFPATFPVTELPNRTADTNRPPPRAVPPRPLMPRPALGRAAKRHISSVPPRKV